MKTRAKYGVHVKFYFIACQRNKLFLVSIRERHLFKIDLVIFKEGSSAKMWMIYVNLSTNNAIENKNIEYVY